MVALFRIGAPLVLFWAAIDWSKYQTQGHAPGALSPAVARAVLTKQANRKRWEAAKARRAGYSGLLRAVHGQTA